MKNAIKILHLEDNHTDAILVHSILESAKIQFEYFLADNEETFHSYLKNQKIDIILSDYHLPDYRGNEALIWVKNYYPRLPFIFVSGTMGEEAAIESLINGATDYVLKNNLERLGSAVNRAIREAKELQARLEAEKQVLKLSRAVEQSPNSILITDSDGNIEYANLNTLTTTGYSSNELIGNNPRIFSSGETSKEEYARLWSTIKSGYIWRGEFLNKKKNGELYWENASISPLMDSKDKIINYLAIKTDITEYKKLTSDLIASKEKAEESDRLKTSFLNNISHEIRTPMNAIVGFSEFLTEPELLPEKRKEYAEIVIQSSKQLLSIITDIIEIAEIEAGQDKVHLTVFELNETLSLMVEQFQLKAEKQNILFTLKPAVPGEAIIVNSDQTKLIQILNNLIINALKFTKHGRISFGYSIKDNNIEFFVQDTGIGIAADMHDEIFKRFRQVESSLARRFGGSGLGLSIAKAYVNLLGGTIWLESEPGKGTCFYFTIPYNKAPERSVPEINPDTSLQIETELPKTLLIAEDEDSNFMLLKAMLSAYKINILRAVNGIQAVEICRNNKIDLVLMDIKMPLMDGYEATKQIRGFLPELHVIAQTAYSTNTDKEKIFAAGCNDYIGKPLSKEILVSKIKVQLEKS